MISRTVFGAVLPILFLLAGWWGSVPFIKEDAWIAAIAGFSFVLGLALSIIIFKKRVEDVYAIDCRIVILVYIFYSVCTFGFFMGVPVFNIIPGLFLGLYAGRRLHYVNAGSSEAKRAVRRMAIFSTLVYSCFCIMAAVLALSDPYTAGNLQGMLGIESFQVTRSMIWALIIVGGVFTAVLHFRGVKKTARLAAGHGYL